MHAHNRCSIYDIVIYMLYIIELVAKKMFVAF